MQGWFEVAGGVLNPGFCAIDLFDPDDFTAIIDADDERTAQRIGERDHFAAIILACRPLEFDGLTFAQGDELFEFLTGHFRYSTLHRIVNTSSIFSFCLIRLSIPTK